MIHVLAFITAKPGMRDKILEAFRANMPAVHAEQGCIEYGPAIDAEGAGAIQTALGPILRRCRKVGEYGRAEGPRSIAPHGRLRRQGAGDDRQARHPCAQPCRVSRGS